MPKYISQTVAINQIGTPGQIGFGVGVCDPAQLPAWYTALTGTFDPASPNYGNYQCSDGSIDCYIPKFYYRFHQQFNISAATQANPCEITTTANHGFVTGDVVFIANVAGMTQINNLFFTITEVAGQPTKFTLNGINSGAYGAWSSGGNVCKRQSAISAPGFNPTILTYNVNSVDIRGADTFTTTALANAEGYALHRAFVDGGIEQPGFFVNKYKMSIKAQGAGYVGASVKYGKPLSTAAAHNPVATLSAVSVGNIFAAMIQAPKDKLSINGAHDAASAYFCCSRFIHTALALIALAHGQASNTDTYCAWYNATYNFPKGCNNNNLKDVSDATVTYAGDGYSICGTTGSGVPFAKTTHNGQDSGVADLNGLMYEVSIGATCIAATKAIEAMSHKAACKITITGHGYVDTDMVQINAITQADWSGCKDKLWQITYVDANNFTINFNSSAFGTAYDAATNPGTITKGTFYVAKSATAMKNFTAGNSLATDHWGAAGVAAMMDALTPATVASMFKSANGFGMRYGSVAYQVLDEALSGEAWVKTGLGAIKSGSAVDGTGTNLFGQDYYYQYIVNELYLLSCAGWSGGASAGPWCVHWADYRSDSNNSVGGRAACYPL